MKFFKEKIPRNFLQLNHMFLILLILNQLFITSADVGEFEQLLKNRDYKQALIKYNEIKSEENNLKEVITNIYRETNNIDPFLYFTSLINDRNERAALYDLIYNLIIKDGGLTMYPPNTDTMRVQALYSCNTMKYVEKIDNTILNLADKNSQLYLSTYNHIESLKTNLSQRMLNELKGINNDMSNYTTIKSKSTNENLKCMLLLINSNIIVKQYEMLLNNTDTDNIDCSLIVTDGKSDMEIFRKILIARNRYDQFKNNVEINYDVSVTNEFENALINKDFNLALIKMNSINNINLTKKVFKKLYNKDAYSLEDLLYFGSFVTNKNNGDLNVLQTIIDAIFDNFRFNVCEGIKIVDILQQLRFKEEQHEALIEFTNDLKLNLTNGVKESEEKTAYLTLANNYTGTFSVKVNKSYTVDIYDKNGEILLSRVEYFLKKFDNETLCYRRGSVSLTNYDSWYMKNYLILVNWFTFVVVVTRFC